jgi:CheY-like chemotaxis protein
MTADADRRRAILVVEDNPANQMLMEAVLHSIGYAVTIASSADEALECLARELPDLILMDVQLGGQDGLSLTKELKADPATASIPVVAVTAYAMVSDRQRILDAGCAGYIAKPIDTRTLGDEIAGFLK